jgi:hypothetical protein
MNVHRFAIGQSVTLKGTIGMSLQTGHMFRVTGRMPPRDNSPQYRIRNEEERHERGENSGGQRVSQRLRDFKAVAIRSGFGQTLSAGRQNDLLSLDFPGQTPYAKMISNFCDGVHAPRVCDFHIDFLCRMQQRFEHGARAIGDGKKLARFLLFEMNAQLAKEADRLRHLETAQDFNQGVPRSAGERRGLNLVMRDIAAPATGNENLCAEFARTVEHDNRAIGIGARGPNGGHQSGGTSANDGDLCAMIL